ncbi:hypothetical protein AVEN_85639-1 [Araneus ventricosus]|uniref:Uncharacterized protein n=1 Tax=Araneus ventricosus TaxID=182803 RepID=A0A4Y2NV31_ARAVE|nr:hypothetical protein AVEN_85639-1 [Araneus ventricosus]
MAHSISRRQLFEVWMKNPKCLKEDSLIAFIMQELGTLSNSESAVISLKLVLMVDNGLSTLQYQRILEHAENVNCKLYSSDHKVKETKQLCCPHSISMTNISRNNFSDTR